MALPSPSPNLASPGHPANCHTCPDLLLAYPNRSHDHLPSAPRVGVCPSGTKTYWRGVGRHASTRGYAWLRCRAAVFRVVDDVATGGDDDRAADVTARHEVLDGRRVSAVADKALQGEDVAGVLLNQVIEPD